MPIINTQPDVKPLGRYTITEACKALGISRETLRRHTIAGLIAVKYREVNLRPFYTGASILAFWKDTII